MSGGMSGGTSSGFFDELERQLIEVAGSPSLAIAASPAPSSRPAAPPSRLATFSSALRRAFASRPIAMVAASAIFTAIAAIAIVDSGGDTGLRREPGSAPTAHSTRTAQSAPTAQSTRTAQSAPTAASTRIAKTIDAAWEGHACSGCYLTDEATLRGGKLGSLVPVRSIAVHVGGENLRRICVWLVSPNGEAAAGSTCSTNAMLAISGTHSEQDAVLTQGTAAGREEPTSRRDEIALAGGT